MQYANIRNLISKKSEKQEKELKFQQMRLKFRGCEYSPSTFYQKSPEETLTFRGVEYKVKPQSSTKLGEELNYRGAKYFV